MPCIVCHAKTVLAPRISLLCRQAVPLHRFHVNLRNGQLVRLRRGLSAGVPRWALSVAALQKLRLSRLPEFVWPVGGTATGKRIPQA